MDNCNSMDYHTAVTSYRGIFAYETFRSKKHWYPRTNNFFLKWKLYAFYAILHKQHRLLRPFRHRHQHTNGQGKKTISAASTHLLNVPVGKKADSSLNFSFSLEELVLKDSELLTNDTELDMNASLHLRVAYAIAFEASMGFTTHWGVPFHNLTIYDIAYNSTTHVFSFFINFDNHASYPVNGTLTAKLYNSTNALIDSATQNVNVPSGESFQTSFAITIDDPSNMTHNGIIRLYFVDAQISEKEWTFP